MKMVNVADLKDPNDSKGRTYREINSARKHKYKVGQGVKTEDGWVTITHLSRDCDGTPLYSYESHGLSEDGIVDSI